MNRLVMVLITFVFINNVNGGETPNGYKGINFGTSIESATASLKSQGLNFTKEIDASTESEVLFYPGRILDGNVKVQYYFTPQTHKMYQAILGFIAIPDGVKEILTAKYGPPSGDAIWLFENGTKIMISYSIVIYSNVRLSQIAKQETEMLKEEKKRHILKDLESAMEDF